MTETPETFYNDETTDRKQADVGFSLTQALFGDDVSILKGPTNPLKTPV